MINNRTKTIARSLRFIIDRFRAKFTYRELIETNFKGVRFDHPSPKLPHVLFITSNGAGMGHITRCMAIASAGASRFHSSFVTLSSSAAVVGAQGFQYIYFQSANRTGWNSRKWNDNFYQLIKEILKTNSIDAVVFDGTWIYRGLRDAIKRSPGMRLIWLRRGLWREHTPIAQLPEMEAACSKVISPWDAGFRFDRGPLFNRDGQEHVKGVVFANHVVHEREESLQALGLDPHRRYALVQLGAGVINDISDLREMIVGHIGKLSGGQIVPVIAISPLSSGDVNAVGAVVVKKFPLYPYLDAFDFAVSAAGYNSVHELLLRGIPSLFIPNLSASTDDQAARARGAAELGENYNAIDESDILLGLDALISRTLAGDERPKLKSKSEQDPLSLDDGTSAAMVISNTLN